MTTVIPYNQKIVHPDARWSYLFNDYANYAAWSAAVAADPNTFGAPNVTGAPTPVIDATYPFNGGKSLWVANNQYISAFWSDNIAPYDTFQSVWMRVWVYHDPGAAANFDDNSYSTFPYMEGDNAATLDYWVAANGTSLSIPGPGSDSYALDPDTRDELGTPIIDYGGVPYSNLAGIWVPVIVFTELIHDGTAGKWGHKRQRMWKPNGAKAIDTTYPVSNDVAAISHVFHTFDFAMNFYGTVAPVYAYGQFEFIPGESNPAPYCGLQDFNDCYQWGGVTQITHTIRGGTIRSNVSLGGQPKGGYKRWKPLLLRKRFPTLPIERPIDPPVEGGIKIAALTEETTIAASGFTDTAIQLPAKSTILSVSVEVKVAIPAPTTGFAVGTAADVNKFQTATVGTTVGSSDPGNSPGAYFNATATAVRLSMIGGSPAAATGKVRVTINYITSA